MSERLIQKASTLRKPKRSSLLSLPGGWLPSPLVFLPLASDTLCYSRVISDWPPPSRYFSVHSLTVSLFALFFSLLSLLLSSIIFFLLFCFFIFLQYKYSLLFLRLCSPCFFYFTYSFKSSFSFFSLLSFLFNIFPPLYVFYSPFLPFPLDFSFFYSLLLFLFSRSKNEGFFPPPAIVHGPNVTYVVDTREIRRW